MSTDLRISQICRVCVQEEENMLPLFEIDSTVSEPFVETLRHASNLEYLPYEELPRQICPACLSQARVCVEFQKLCLLSESIFTQFLLQKETESSEYMLQNIPSPLVVSNIESNSMSELLIEPLVAEPEVDVDCTLLSIEDLSGNNTNSLDIEVLKDGTKAFNHSDEMIDFDDSYLHDILNITVHCSECNCVFVSTAKLKEHLQTHKNVNPADVFLKCKVPEDKPTVQSDQPKSPNEIVTKKVFSCKLDSCGHKSFSDIEHSLHVHTHKGGRKRHQCEICDKTFSTIGNLKQHQRIHSDDKPFNCSYCDKKFVQRSSLKSHEVTHISEIKHVCELCGKAYTRLAALRNHFQTNHSGTSFQCEMCNKKFLTKRSLTTHMFTHTNTRFNCDTCKQSFSRKDSLKYHRKIHKGIKPHVCSVCDKRFLAKHVLRYHMKTHGP